MAKKILFSLAVGIFIGTLAGAAVESLAISTSNSVLIEPSADPESDLAMEQSWRPQEHSETGAILDRMEESHTGSQGSPTEDGLAFEPNGSAELRPGIDDGQ